MRRLHRPSPRPADMRCRMLVPPGRRPSTRPPTPQPREGRAAPVPRSVGTEVCRTLPTHRSGTRPGSAVLIPRHTPTRRLASTRPSSMRCNRRSTTPTRRSQTRTRFPRHGAPIDAEFGEPLRRAAPTALKLRRASATLYGRGRIRSQNGSPRCPRSRSRTSNRARTRSALSVVTGFVAQSST